MAGLVFEARIDITAFACGSLDKALRIAAVGAWRYRELELFARVKVAVLAIVAHCRSAGAVGGSHRLPPDVTCRRRGR